MQKRSTLIQKVQWCLASLFLFALPMVVSAQSSYDKGEPFGFATCTSRTATGYNLTGGGAWTPEGIEALSGKRVITLTSTGSDMRGTIEQAIGNNDVIIFDGSKGNFILTKFADLKDLKNKTIIGINGATLATEWYATDEDRKALDAANVKSKSTSSGSNTKLLPGETKLSIKEEAEYCTRYALIQLHDPDAIKNNTLSAEPWIKSGIFYIRGCENIVIRNLKFQGPGAMDVGGQDLISIVNDGSQYSSHIWVDHCDFQDGQDGNMDITNGSDFVTVSWCKFHYSSRSYMHMNTNLCGSTNDNTYGDDDKLSITWTYNNWAEGCNERMPLARYGRFHLLNNYYTCTNNEAGINPRIKSEMLIEGNYFNSNMKNIYKADVSGTQMPTQVIWRSNNFVGNSSATHPTADDATAASTLIPYSYSTDLATDKVPTEVGENVGATLFGSGPSYPIVATWAFDSYGAYGTSSTGFQYQKKTGTLVSSKASISMAVDATNGKLSSRAADTQWNVNTILKIPVNSPKDKIYVKAKTNAYTVGGKTTTDAEATYNVSYECADANLVEIVATGNNYLYNITLTENEPNTTVPELMSYSINGKKYYPGDMSSTPTATSVNILKSATMISAENPLTDVKAVCGTVGTITYNVATDNNSCVATIPVTLGSQTVNYTVNVIRLQTVDVTFYGLDGTTVLDKKTVSAGNAIGDIFPANPTPAEGYTFRGWFDAQAEGANAITSATVANDFLSVYAVATKTEVCTSTSHIIYDLRVKAFTPSFHDLMNINGTYSFNGTTHGIVLNASNTIDLTVGGPAYIYLSSCKYSAGNYTLTGCDPQAAKVTTDGDNVIFHYTGQAGTITLGFTGTTYLHKIDVYNTASTIAKNDAGYYVVAANDESSLMLNVMQANKETAGAKIYVPNGTYNVGNDLNLTKSGIEITANNVSLIGESMENTIIKGHGIYESINTATVKTTGDNFYAQDITFECYADYKSGDGSNAERALGLWNRSAHSTLKNVYLKGWQDTYYTNSGSAGQLGYVEGGKIEGTVDFICGAGNHFFKGVNLNCTNSAHKTSGDYIAVPNTFSSEKGYVFDGCNITAEAGQKGTYYLGRAWGDGAANTFLNTIFTDEYNANVWAANMSSSVTYHRFAVYPAISGVANDEKALAEPDATISNVLGTWATTAQTEATQVTTWPIEGIFLVDGTITATRPTSGYARVANTRGGFGPTFNAATGEIVTAINAVNADANVNANKAYGKFIQNGQIIIVKDGKKYTVAGAQIR